VGIERYKESILGVGSIEGGEERVKVTTIDTCKVLPYGKGV
jgi:hypothetical protein